MAFTSIDLVRIEEAISSGALTVKYQDRTVTYQDMTSLLRARSLILQDINAASGVSGTGLGGTGRRNYATFSKGIEDGAADVKWIPGGCC